MNNLMTGSCLCGAIHFEIDGEFDSFYLCHCSYCRKGTGSSNAANLFSSTAVLTWLSGKEQVREFILPGTRHCRAFCSQCGSALPLIQESDKLLLVPAGSIENDIPIRPTAHIYMASRANWDNELELVQRFAELPE